MKPLVKIAAQVNLKDAVILLLEPNLQGMAILTQIMMGFGSKRLLKAETYSQAKTLIETNVVDLIITESALRAADEPDGYDFVHWLRRSQLEPNAYAPVLVASSHTSLLNVSRARDCGATFFITEPLAPTVMLDRILWMARENRPFVGCATYVGPDRRFKNVGPPVGSHGRRSTDLPAEVGAAVAPNMSQDEIDSLMTPQRANA